MLHLKAAADHSHQIGGIRRFRGCNGQGIEGRRQIDEYVAILVADHAQQFSKPPGIDILRVFRPLGTAKHPQILIHRNKIGVQGKRRQKADIPHRLHNGALGCQVEEHGHIPELPVRIDDGHRVSGFLGQGQCQIRNEGSLAAFSLGAEKSHYIRSYALPTASQIFYRRQQFIAAEWLHQAAPAAGLDHPGIHFCIPAVAKAEQRGIGKSLHKPGHCQQAFFLFHIQQDEVRLKDLALPQGLLRAAIAGCQHHILCSADDAAEPFQHDPAAFYQKYAIFHNNCPSLLEDALEPAAAAPLLDCGPAAVRIAGHQFSEFLAESGLASGPYQGLAGLQRVLGSGKIIGKHMIKGSSQQLLHIAVIQAGLGIAAIEYKTYAALVIADTGQCVITDLHVLDGGNKIHDADKGNQGT